MLNTINPANLTISHQQWVALMPLVIVTLGILVSMLIATIPFMRDVRSGEAATSKRQCRMPVFLFSTAVMLGACAWTATHWIHEPIVVFNGMLTLDYFSSFFTVLLCGATALIMMGSYSYLDGGEIHFSEFYAVMMAATLGMLLLVSATELLTLFIALELMSLMVYVLVGMRRMNAFSNEASIKYFVMGGVAAAVYLYGTALIYGALNTTKLSVIFATLAQQQGVLSNPILVAGVVLLLVGFLFKIAAAPFHTWTPDVYEGAPANITAYMATALKAAVFAALIRVSVSVFGDNGVHLFGNLQVKAHDCLWVLALLTMIIGNFVALMQPNLKRLMAYSAIAHTGYLLVGLLAAPTVGYSGIIFYLVAYVAMNIGAFLLLTLFPGKADEGLTLDSLRGLGKRHPCVALCLTVFLLSLGGFPPTAGFVGKYYLFSGAMQAGETTLVLIAVLTSAVSVYYYLRLVVLMYMEEGTELSPFRSSYFAYAAIAICLILTIGYGVQPGSLLHAVKKAAVF